MRLKWRNGKERIIIRSGSSRRIRGRKMAVSLIICIIVQVWIEGNIR